MGTITNLHPIPSSHGPLWADEDVGGFDVQMNDPRRTGEEVHGLQQLPEHTLNLRDGEERRGEVGRRPPNTHIGCGCLMCIGTALSRLASPAASARRHAVLDEPLERQREPRQRDPQRVAPRVVAHAALQCDNTEGAGNKVGIEATECQCVLGNAIRIR